MKIIVGSRGSNLALTQTNMIIDEIEKLNPHIKCEVKIIKTKGDLILDKPIHKIGGKQIFIKEIEKELLEGTIDMAVHSMKDMPGDLPKGLKLSFIPKREDYRDVLVLREGLRSIEDIPLGGKIGTGSKRRHFQMLEIRPDLEIVGIRGNVETRIKKIESENLDATILAAAGISRLSLDLGDRAVFLDRKNFLPSPGQGILAIEVREDDEKIDNILKTISDRETEIQARAERDFLKSVGGSCSVPVGAYCEIKEDRIILEGLLGSSDGEILIRMSIEKDIEDFENIGKELGEKVLEEMNRL